MKLRDFTLKSWDVNLVCQLIINRFYYTIMGFYQSWDVSFPSPTDPTKTPRETKRGLKRQGSTRFQVAGWTGWHSFRREIGNHQISRDFFFSIYLGIYWEYLLGIIKRNCIWQYTYIYSSGKRLHSARKSPFIIGKSTN